MTDVQEAAREYLGDGRDLVRIKRGEKAPVERWQDRHPRPSDFEPADQIGIKCGDPSGGLVCIDADCTEAVGALPAFVSRGNARIDGRTSKPDSHWWVLSPGAKTRRFKDVDGSTILEVLATGTYAVAPPSQHPSGETRAWAEPRPALKPYDLSNAAFIAVAALLARHWPSQRGSRHDLAGPLAGLLLRCGVDAPLVPIIIEVAARLGGDDQVDDRVRYARDTVTAFASRRHVTGGPKVAEILGATVKSRVCSFLAADDLGVIDDLNERWFIVDVGGKPVVGEELTVTEKGRTWTTFEFRTFAQLKDHLVKAPPVVVGHKADGSPIYKDLADYWIKHPDGRQFRRLVYEPRETPPAPGMPDLNGWRGFTVPPAPGDWPKTQAFIKDVICDGDEAKFGWLLDWCADLFQHPDQHADTTPVFIGRQGTGKNVFWETVVGWCFDGRHQAVVVNTNSILGDFNERLSGLVLLTLDEVSLTHAQSTALRGLVTAHSLDINRKNIHLAHERSMLHISIISNEEVPVFLDRDDRRFAVFRVSSARQNDHAYFREIETEMANGGRAAMLHELLRRAYRPDALRLAPDWQDKRDVKAGSLTPQQSALRHWLLLEERVGLLEPPREEFFKTLRGERHQPDEEGWTDDQLGKLIKKIWPDMPDSRKRKDGRQIRIYKFGLVSDARAQFDTALGISTDWPTTKMDDLVDLARWQSIDGPQDVLEQNVWGLIHLAITLLKRLGVDVGPLEGAEENIRRLGVIDGPPSF